MFFVLSTGRAGSRTIANVLSQHPEAVCTHEPLPRLLEETAGWRYGEVSTEDLRQKLVESRPAAIDGRRYGESANRLSLAVPVLADAFSDARFLWVTRDGRDFVNSGFQRGWYDPDRVRDTPWERMRLRAPALGEKSQSEWDQWTPFHKTCWLWRRTNEIIRTDLAALEPDRWLHVRLEDLGERIGEVAQFLDLEPIDWVVPRLNARAAVPDTGVGTANQIDHRLVAEEWTESQAADFAAECGSLMDELYAGWAAPTEGVSDDAGLADAGQHQTQVDLGELRQLRGELNLLTAHVLRVDRRTAAEQTRNKGLTERNAALTEQVGQLRLELASMESARDRALEAGQAAQAQRDALLGQKDAAVAQKKELANVVRALEQSESYRIGHRLVRLFRAPTRMLRRRRSTGSAGVAVPTAEPEKPEVSPGRTVEPDLALRVGTVLDEFTHDCFEDEFRVVPLDRAGWRDQLPDLDLVFVESAWRGNGATWSYTLNKFEKNGADVRELTAAARAAGIPSVFWNKEDPVSFDVFLPAAAAFDQVFTTDADVVDAYRDSLGHDHVGALPFAAQPRLHNPIGRARGLDVPGRVCFAGSWRGDKYTQRGGDFDTLLRPPLERGVLDIYDRYAGGPDADKLGFPEPFRSAVVGSLPYSEMAGAYRAFAGFLNVNSVNASPTMFSRRVFELLACGTPVISTHARGIEEMLGDVVLTTDSPEKTAEYVDWVINDPDGRDRHAHRGYRLVHRDHTYRARTDQLLAGIDIDPARPRRRVSMICVSNRVEQVDHVVESYVRQTYLDKNFIYVANSSAIDDDHLESIRRRVPGARVMRVDEAATLGDCLNEALAVADGDFFAKMDDDDHYGAEYLTDLMLAFGYTDAAVVGKQCYYAYLAGRDETFLRFPGKEFRAAPRVIGGTIVADRSKVGDIRFESVPRGTDSRFLEAVKASGHSIFSADRYNFCQVRQADPGAHTWGISEEEFLRVCTDVGPGLADEEIFV